VFKLLLCIKRLVVTIKTNLLLKKTLLNAFVIQVYTIYKISVLLKISSWGCNWVKKIVYSFGFNKITSHRLGSPITNGG